MSAPARALMAGLACFVTLAMIRAWRSGTLFSDGWAFSALATCHHRACSGDLA
jgi:hypothetical protein